ncbi:MAG: DEAD/DEAH box helicase, partial [Saprospiraceae bacterium]
MNSTEITFDDLNLSNPLWKALQEEGLLHPTTIQKKALSAIMSGRDVQAIAQTGTGKTLAYLIPLFKSWTFTKTRHASILIIVPTRELAVQVMEEARMLGKYMNIVVKAVYGGTNLKTQAFEVAEGVDILIGTPG